MMFQLLGDWHPGNMSLEASSIIDGNDPQWAGVMMPLNARALDVEAANALVGWYPFNQSALQFAPGIQPTLRINV